MSTRTVERPAPQLAERVARLRTPAVVAAGAAAVFTYIGSVSPYASGNYPSCPLYALTGLYCPGCGSLRSLHSLANGDLLAAFARNPIMPPLLLILTVVLMRWAVLRWRGERLVWEPPTWVPIAIGVAVIAYGVARNIPALTLLSPL
jgi:hypothetical protein